MRLRQNEDQPYRTSEIGAERLQNDSGVQAAVDDGLLTFVVVSVYQVAARGWRSWDGNLVVGLEVTGAFMHLVQCRLLLDALVSPKILLRVLRSAEGCCDAC